MFIIIDIIVIVRIKLYDNVWNLPKLQNMRMTLRTMTEEVENMDQMQVLRAEMEPVISYLHLLVLIMAYRE